MQPLKVEQFFVPGNGWQELNKPITLNAFFAKRAYAGATSVRIVGKGDFTVKEIKERGQNRYYWQDSEVHFATVEELFDHYAGEPIHKDDIEYFDSSELEVA